MGPHATLKIDCIILSVQVERLHSNIMGPLPGMILTERVILCMVILDEKLDNLIREVTNDCRQSLREDILFSTSLLELYL
jgi:hypothetical protein